MRQIGRYDFLIFC